MQNRQTFLHSVFESFNTAGYKYVIARRAEEIYTTGPRDDIDIVVDRKFIELAVTEILSIADKMQATRILFKNSKNIIQLAFVIPEANNLLSVAMLDLQTDIMHQGVVLMSGNRMLQDRIVSGEHWRPCYAAEVAGLIFHDVVTKKKFQDYDVVFLKKIVTQSENLQLLKTILTDFIGFNTANRLIDFLRISNFQAILQMRKEILSCRKKENLFANQIWKTKNIIQQFSYLFKRRGAFIVFVGPDGSGKTTLLNNTQKHLNNTGIPVSQVYFGLTTPLLPTKIILRKLRHGSKSGDSNSSDVDMMKSLNMKKRIFYFLGALHAFIDIYLRYFVYAKMPLSRSHIVLADRYYYDLLINPMPNSLSKVMFYLVTKLTPKPDLVYVVMDKAENIYSRKPELAVSEIQRQQNIFLGLSTTLDNIVAINQTRDFDDVANQAASGVIEHYSQRNG